MSVDVSMQCGGLGQSFFGVYLSMANSNPQVVNRWSKDLFDSLYFLIET